MANMQRNSANQEAALRGDITISVEEKPVHAKPAPHLTNTPRLTLKLGCSMAEATTAQAN